MGRGNSGNGGTLGCEGAGSGGDNCALGVQIRLAELDEFEELDVLESSLFLVPPLNIALTSSQA